MNRNGQLPDGNLDRGYCQRLHNPESFRGIHLNHFPWPLLLSIWQYETWNWVAWVIGRDKKSPRPLACVIHSTVHWNLQVLCGYCVLSSLVVCQRTTHATFSWRYEKFEIPPLFDKFGSWFPQLFENSVKMSCFSFVFPNFLSWLIL